MNVSSLKQLPQEQYTMIIERSEKTYRNWKSVFFYDTCRFDWMSIVCMVCFILFFSIFLSNNFCKSIRVLNIPGFKCFMYTHLCLLNFIDIYISMAFTLFWASAADDGNLRKWQDLLSVIFILENQSFTNTLLIIYQT